MTETAVFDIRLPGVRLECGAELPYRRVRGWAWGPEGTIAHLSECGASILSAGDAIPTQERVVLGRSLDSERAPTRAPRPLGVPVVVLVHALTGDMRAGGPGGWWGPVIGPGEPIDPRTHLVVCFNNLGGCYGSTGPDDAEFPKRSAETCPLPPPPPRGSFRLPDDVPATVTPWDQARTHLEALDAIGVADVDLLSGGSVGGMQALCMAMLAPARFRRLVPVAASLDAPAWILAFNHVARQTVLLDRSMRGLELARQLAHITYRSPAGMADRYGRGMTMEPDGAWSSRAAYQVQTYLEHQGRKLTTRFAPAAYLCALDAMDHHDVARRPPWVDDPSWGLERITAPTLSVVIDSDQLFVPQTGCAIAERLVAAGRAAEVFTIRSEHGHDAFLIEWEQVRAALRAAWSMRPSDP